MILHYVQNDKDCLSACSQARHLHVSTVIKMTRPNGFTDPLQQAFLGSGGEVNCLIEVRRISRRRSLVVRRPDLCTFPHLRGKEANWYNYMVFLRKAPAADMAFCL